MQGLNTFSPCWYYRSRLSLDSINQIKNHFTTWVAEKNNFACVDSWSCNAKSSFENKKASSAPWELFLHLLEPVLDDFCRDLGCTATYMKISQVWANKYSKGAFQECHSHVARSNQLSFCYFYKPVKDVSLFKFVNREHDIYELSGLLNVLDNAPGRDSDIRLHNLQEGDIILFPSYYPHMVDPNPGEEERITFSGNIEVKNI